MLSQIPLLLTWRSQRSVAETIAAAYISHATLKFQDLLDTSSGLDPASGPSALFIAYSQLPTQSQLRFLHAPETYSRVIRRKPNGNDRIFVEESVEAEWRLLSESKIAIQRPVWSALGDVLIHAPGVSNVTTFRSPQLIGGAVADFFSPHSYLGGGSAGVTAPHNSEEASRIIPALNDALVAIDQISSAAFDVVAIATRTVVVRKTAEGSLSFGSSSWSSSIGKVGLTNAHLPHVTVAQLANALIHEAIHSILYMIELHESFYLDEQATEGFTVISPWSGRNLPLPSYLHACFVWFGLTQFWRMAIDKGTLSEELSNHLLERAASGFRGGSITNPVEPLRHCLSPVLLEALKTVQDVTGTRYSSPLVNSQF